MKLYITGCAKSGTTLVRRLFGAFDLRVYHRDELSVSRFLASDWQVAKRAYGTVFSGGVSDPDAQVQLRCLQAQGVHIVNVVRGREAVLRSDHGYVTPARYELCQHQRERFGASITFEIAYEALVREPDEIQAQLARRFDLDVLHKWSDYPAFVDLSLEAEVTHRGIYGLRPLGAPADPAQQARGAKRG